MYEINDLTISHGLNSKSDGSQTFVNDSFSGKLFWISNFKEQDGKIFNFVPQEAYNWKRVKKSGESWTSTPGSDMALKKKRNEKNALIKANNLKKKLKWY